MMVMIQNYQRDVLTKLQNVLMHHVCMMLDEKRNGE